MMNLAERGGYSIYNVIPPEGEHPLKFLAGDYEHGWLTARNLRKALNHIGIIQEQEAAALSLNLHNTESDPAIFGPLLALLEQHQQQHISTDGLIQTLTYMSTKTEGRLSETEVREKLRKYAKVPHMEFHPSDVCNLTCLGCTYGHDDPAAKPRPVNYPYELLFRISEMQPKSIVIVGGGEPTLYRDGNYKFANLVRELRDQNPTTKLSLITNGTFKPEGDWPDEFTYIRVSVDAATPETFTAFRGKPMFQKVIENYLAYLNYDLPAVGISFLFSRYNVHEYAQVNSFIYDLVNKYNPNVLKKVNIQYRPLRRDPKDYNKPFNEAISEQQIQQTMNEILLLAHRSPDMERFLREQTNITAILGGNSHSPYEFSRCRYTQIFRIIRANGDIRPCFIRVTEPKFLLGNILTDEPETIALNMLYVATKADEHCNEYGCRQSHVNYVIEKGLDGEMQPSESVEVQNDPFF